MTLRRNIHYIIGEATGMLLLLATHPILAEERAEQMLALKDRLNEVSEYLIANGVPSQMPEEQEDAHV